MGDPGALSEKLLDRAHRRSGCGKRLSTVVGNDDMVGQIEQILVNLRAALEAGGARPEHIIKWNIYVVEGQPLQAVFPAFQNAWPKTPNPPAITMVLVSGLALPGFLVEMALGSGKQSVRWRF